MIGIVNCCSVSWYLSHTYTPQLWALKNEVSVRDRQTCNHLGVTVCIFEDFVKKRELKQIDSNVGLRLFQLKPLAILHSSFEEVLLIDADNTPVVDPSFLFDHPQYTASTAVFWPDYWKTHSGNPIWNLMMVCVNIFI